MDKAPSRHVRRSRLIPIWALLLGAFIVAAIGSVPYYAGNDSYVLSLLGKFLCFAIFALSIDLIWGYAGILSLGQAVYFGMGAYFVALSLKINYAMEHPTRYGSKFPDFMEWNGLKELPAFMTPLISTPFAVICALVVPTILAFIFGVITFKRHIYGVYCAVITLAEALILQEFIIEYQTYLGGIQRHHRLLQLRRGTFPVAHSGCVGRLLRPGPRHYPFAHRHRSKGHPRQ